MNSRLLDKVWVVYKHTSPSNKVYIGITSKIPTDRWASGFGYEHQVYFFRAIVKYGWINFKHEILFKGLTKTEAEAKEVELIAQYKSADLNYGYNIDLGGDNHKLSLETRKKISDIKKGKIWTERQRLASIEYFKKNPGKKVFKYDLQGNLVDSFVSCKEACKDARVTYKTFQWYMCTKRFPTKWKYVYSYGTFSETLHKRGHGAYNALKVDMYDLSLNYIRTFNSIAEAGRWIKETTGKGTFKGVWAVCNRKKLKHGNYIWRYHNESTNNKSA